ncbi:integrase [Haemophilus influenzae]|uniref:DDE-type integrase/transposase/recombinase n=1 Tax=Haemophilus influenzae TaxID=727 RepID=UPI000680A4F5|nr:DDE-type integrase/transposase/recombinase [Haemophilus influenzae]KMZ24206.1 integrase [Haemophilus influenzae]KMZ26704.1 integrase [Haemophilus influenzae]
MAILPSVLAQYAERVEKAVFGEKEKIIEEGCAFTGLSRATFLRQIKPYRPASGRKVRSDKGKHQMDANELKLISAAWLHLRRKNGKTMATLERILDILRANDKVKAEFVDEKTGEVRPYSASSVERALRNANLHPDQLLRPAPVVQLQSRHPNHVWQIDPSLCVLYYLKETGKGNGLCVMEAEQFYKNKPANVVKVEPQRVWRYVITDHASGVIYVEYVYGGETAENISETFINAIQKKENPAEPFFGVPKILMFDRGSANTSQMFTHLLNQLDVKIEVPKAHNARAKGQVEKGNDIVERQFESGLRFMNVSGLAELNQLAHQWMRYFNAKAVHSRHGMTRYSAWQKIHAKDLIYPPSREICQELMITALTERLVTDKLEISFENHRYDVRDVPDVKIGEKITVGKNPYRLECVQVHCFEQVFADDGTMSLKPYWVVLEPVKINELGFRVDAAIIGEEYKAHRKTAFETNKEQAEQLAYGVETEDELKRAKKANKPLFNGEINPYQHIENTDLNWYMPKKGQEHELTTNARRVEQKPMSVVEFAKNGKARWGELWNGECYQWVNGRYPQGVPPLEAERLLSLGFEDFKAEFVAPEPKTSHLKLLAA